MSVGSWIRDLTDPFFKSSRKPRNDPRATFAAGTSTAAPGLSSWSDSRLDQVRAYRHWTYVAISRIAERIASQHPNVGLLETHKPQSGPGGSPIRSHYSLELRRKALTPLQNHHDLVPVDDDHPLVRLLADPNEPDTGFDLWYETILFLLLTGNAYWWGPKNPVTGLPAALWVLPSHWVWPIYATDGSIECYELRPSEGNYLRRRFPAEEIIHIRKKSPVSKVDGYSAQTAGAQWLDTQLSIDRSRWYTFKNHAAPSVALEFDPAFIDPSSEDLDRIEAKFMARYSGETRAGKPLMLPPGVKFHKLSLMPREMDYCGSADQMRDQILALFGVPAVIAGIVKDLTSTGVISAHSVFCSCTINPLCRMIGSTLSEKFAKWYDDPLRLWFDDTTPEDPAMVEKQLKTDMDGMAVTPNEVRARRGRPPYEHGGDDPIQPHVGLVMPWGSGKDVNAVNPFGPANQVKPKKPSQKPAEDDPPAEDD